jgi:HEAT repeat protein
MSLNSLIEKFMSDDWDEKIKTAGEILKLGEKAEPELLLALTHENPDVRYWSLKILGEISPEKYSSYAEAMLEDEAWFVRSQAAVILGESGKEKYEDLLKEKIKDENSEDVIEYMKKAIKNLKKTG